MKKIDYKADETGLLLTRCKHFDCLVGGWYCVNCRAFEGKDLEKKQVSCNIDTVPKNNYSMGSSKKEYYRINRDEILTKKAARLKKKNEQKHLKRLEK